MNTCETTKRIESTPALAKLLIETRETLKEVLKACRDRNTQQPEETANGTTNVRHARV